MEAKWKTLSGFHLAKFTNKKLLKILMIFSHLHTPVIFTFLAKVIITCKSFSMTHTKY